MLQCRQCLLLERRVVRWSAHDPIAPRTDKEGPKKVDSLPRPLRTPVAGRGGTFEMVCVSSRRTLACIGLAENTFWQAVFVMLQSPCTHRVRN